MTHISCNIYKSKIDFSSKKNHSIMTLLLMLKYLLFNTLTEAKSKENFQKTFGTLNQ